MSKRDDERRKAMWANIDKYRGVTKRNLPELVTENFHKSKHTGKGYFEKKKPVLTKKGIEYKAPKHSEDAKKRALKKKYENTLRVPMKAQNQPFALHRDLPLSVLKTTVKFAKPIAPIIGEITGLKESALITKEVLNSFENSIEVYEETNNIDEAIISGVKSFVINYAKDKMEGYIGNIVSINNNESNKDFEAALKGSILITSLYSIMENVEGILDNDNL